MGSFQIGAQLRRLRHIINGRKVCAEDCARSADQIKAVSTGHRDYVGGLWDAMGSLQFQFMLGRGLTPHNVFLDIGCGSLRGGAKFIPYLDCGNYLGLDASRELIDAGLENELERSIFESKRPEFVVSDCFEFSHFSKRPDFALAQAVLIHLPESEIRRCFDNLKAVSHVGTKFYATYVIGRKPRKIELASHPYVIFQHTKSQMVDFGRHTGWRVNYIGDWGHPRGQVIVEYTAN